jgi:trehalose 6-phosphate synthase/phosphatase
VLPLLLPPPHTHIPLQVSDVAVVTATRDGMNLVPYEYVVCRQGPEAAAAARQSMLVVSGAAAAANTVKKVLT